MAFGRRVRAATLLTAAFVVCGAGLPMTPAAAADDDSHLMLFSGRDLWRNGFFGFGGMILSPGGFDQDGFLLKLLYSGGIYRYRAGDLDGETVIGMELLGQIAPGWQIKRNHFEAKFFFGPELAAHRLRPDDPGNALRGRSFGLRFAAELWDEPTAQSMIAADASLSSIGANFSARFAIGWRVLDEFYLGPETQLYGGDGYRQYRLGTHITSMKTGEVEWSAACGWSIDTDRQSSPYVRLSLLQRFY
jgi:hypothetical protein